MSKKWYVVHTYSGYESKVKLALEEQLQKEGLDQYVSQILMPTENVVEIKSGKKKISARKFYPGYIVVEMDMTYDAWLLIKNTPKVTGFLGGENTPTPLGEEEIEHLLGQIERGVAGPKHKVTFEKNEKVMITDGPFVNFNGFIEEVNEDKGKVKVMVSIFGRPTPVELEFPQVERVED